MNRQLKKVYQKPTFDVSARLSQVTAQVVVSGVR